MSDIVERIAAYLAGGGLFNPELANHDAVRDLLIDARAENERLREALKETLAIARRNEAGDYVDRARAALEGVTEKSGAGNE